MIRTPDQRLRVFVSSTLGELAEERLAVRRAVEGLHLLPVMFELGARPYPPRELYRAYLEQSHVFVGVYWQRYGWVAPGEDVSGLEDELRLADGMPQLLYVKHPAPEREPALTALLRQVQERDRASYRRFSSLEELEEMVARDLAVLLSERFDPGDRGEGARPTERPALVPLPLTRTVGREHEVAAVVGLLDGGDRLVTVTGPGGVGKSRLAVEVARVLAARPGATVHFVPLEAVSSPGLVLAAVADAIGVRREAGRPPLEALVEHLGDRPTLLVLDNLEQVVRVGPELTRLLELAPGLRVLATSRQPLRVVAEHEYPVRPLGVPGEADSPEEVGRASAVELLVERAGARGVPLELTAESSAAVGELCRRLGGLPLAIELVVPRLRLLDPRALLERLGSTLDLPCGGDDLPARQRTMRATLAWSHDLLDESERLLLARLGVFAGGATLDAVESVCSGAVPDVETALAGLLDKSLLHLAEPSTGGELRIQLLEPVRDLAREQLDLQGRTGETRRRHLDYFAGVGREAQPYLCGPLQREWAARFDAERANVRAAIATGLETRSYETVLRLTWDTMVYYYVRDAVEEPRRWLEEVACADADLDRTQQALRDVGLLIVGGTPRHDDPGQMLDSAAGVFEAAGLALEAAVSRHYLGLHHWQAGRLGAAVEMLEDASRRYDTIDHDWGVAMVEMTLGAARAREEDRRRSRAHFLEALARARRIENRPQTAQSLQGLALVDALEGRAASSRRALTESAALVLADRSLTGATYCLEALAAVLLAEGRPQDAVRLLGAARGARRRRMVPEWTAAGDAAAPVLAEARGRLPAETFSVLWQTGLEQSADVLEVLARGLSGMGEPVDTRSSVAAAVD